MTLRYRSDEATEFIRGQRPGPPHDDLGQLRVLAWVDQDQLVPNGTLKIECSMTWHLRTERGDSPSAVAFVTHSWTNDGKILAIDRLPKNGKKCCPNPWSLPRYMSLQSNRMDWASVESSKNKHAFVSTWDCAEPGDTLASTDDAGNRCGMVWVAVGRSGDELVGKIETGKRVHRRHLEGVVQNKIREQARDTLREHGLADSWRAMEEHVMPTRRGYFAGPLGLDLTHYICQVKTMVRMLPRPLTAYLDGVNRRHRNPAQKSDQLGDWGNTEDLDAFNELRLSGLAQRHNHPGETRLLSCQRCGQDPTYGMEATVQPQFPQQDRATKLLGCKDALRREHCSNNREVEVRPMTHLVS
jgi:hypothetical protein